MTSRFSTLQKRDVRLERPLELAASQHVAVVIPTTRKPGPPKAEVGPAKPAKVLDARMRIHRMLIEEINLVAL